MQKVNTNMKKLLGCSTFLGVSFALFLIYAGLNYSGFCFAKMRYLSDEDKFKKYFFEIVQRDTILINEGQNYKRIKYESFEEFMESNPDCCAMVPSPGAYKTANFWPRITGFHSGEVTVMNYTIYYLDENGEQRSLESKMKVIQQNCGQRWYTMELPS